MAAENPYQYNGPIGEIGPFAGREQAFNFIRSNLVSGGRGAALVLLGPHQIGRSSVLRRLPAELDARFVCVRLSLRASTVAGEKTWLTILAEAIPRALEMVEVHTARLPDLPAHPADLREALEGDYMSEGLRALRRDRLLVILIDNAERLLVAVQNRTLPRDSFRFLGSLLEKHDHLALVMAFDSRYEPDLLAVGPPFDPALFYRLRTFSPEELKALLTSALPEGVTYAPEALDQVVDLTGGHPYLAQLMGYLLYERSAQSGHRQPIAAADVQAVTGAALAMGSETLGAIWNNGSDQDKLVLTALSVLSAGEPPTPVPFDDITAWLMAAERPLDPRTVNATWRRLEYEDVLDLSADGRLTIRGGLQRRWLRDHVTLPEGEGQAISWRRTGLIALAAVVILAVFLAVLSALPGPDVGGSSAGATVTLNLDLQATSDSYAATQTAAP